MTVEIHIKLLDMAKEQLNASENTGDNPEIDLSIYRNSYVTKAVFNDIRENEVKPITYTKMNQLPHSFSSVIKILLPFALSLFCLFFFFLFPEIFQSAPQEYCHFTSTYFTVYLQTIMTFPYLTTMPL